MMKNNKGFMLVETLVVSVFVLTTLLYLFVQFQKIENSYDSTFNYNTTNNLYKVANFRTFVQKNGYANLDSAMISNAGAPRLWQSGDPFFIDITSCPATYLSNTPYCIRLIDTLNIKQVIFTKYVVNDGFGGNNLIEELKNLTTISEEMKDFIRYIRIDMPSTANRLIIEFKDGTFGSLAISEE